MNPTTFRGKKLTIEWGTRIPPPNEGWLTSRPFYDEAFEDYKFEIWIRTTNSIYKNNLDISVKTRNKEPARAEITVVVGKTRETKRIGQWIGSCDFVGFQRPCGCHCDTPYLVTCEITWTDTADFFLAPPPPLNLQADIVGYFMDPALSDVTIVIDNEQLHAHKLILASYSRKFLRLFRSLKENDAKVITIHDISYNIMKIILSYLYTGNEEALSNCSVALDVLEVAVNYEMDRLKIFCEYKLFKNLEGTNVLKILDKCHELNSGNLVDECLKFLIQNKKKVPMSELRELCLTKPELMVKFIENIIDE